MAHNHDVIMGMIVKRSATSIVVDFDFLLLPTALEIIAIIIWGILFIDVLVCINASLRHEYLYICIDLYPTRMHVHLILFAYACTFDLFAYVCTFDFVCTRCTYMYMYELDLRA
jgi:hypothetical protein